MLGTEKWRRPSVGLDDNGPPAGSAAPCCCERVEAPRPFPFTPPPPPLFRNSSSECRSPLSDSTRRTSTPSDELRLSTSPF